MELPHVDPPPAKTVESIPRDESTRKKIIDIIDHQFNLEIYLKQREVATIRQEIAKAENILSDLKLAVENESLAASVPEAAHYTRRSALYFHGGSQAVLTPPTAPKRRVYRTSEKAQLFGRRNDGVYVRLSCPACHRDDFANQQGFLNHCRISHNLEFGPYEQIMLQCGTPVDESEVPIDNPARLRPVMNLVPAVAKPQKKLERPSIKVFEEDVDMELENEKRNALFESNYTQQESGVEATEPMETVEESSNVETASVPMDTVEDSNISEQLPEASIVEEPAKEDDNKENTTTEDKSATDETQTKETTEKEKEESPQVESFAAAVTSANTAEVGSRFYIKRRIIVGNVSKFIAPERRDPSLKQFTHKWMIYVVEPPQSKEQVSAFITCVRFHLHPSYKPHDVVDVTEAPFKLTRLGWGEFPIRIQLFFVDKKRNKAVDLIHHLKLDDSHCGKQLLGSERSIEIELDRNTDFDDKSSKPTTTVQEATETEPPAIMAAAQKMSLLGGMLKECVRKLPIVRAGSHGTVLPYSCASSSKAFFSWSLGKRKALEWHRARLLRLETQKRAFEANDNILRLAAKALTTKGVLLWCVKNKYTPVKSDNIEDVIEPDLPPGYCKFCGSVRDGYDETIDDHCPRRPKGWNSRKRNGGINSTTSVTKLVNTFEKGWEDDTMDIDMDEAQPRTTKKIDISFDENAMDVANERSLDWIWSVVGQLRLKSVIANDMMLAKDGNLQGPTSNFDVAAAMNQRLVVGNIMTQATKVFLKKLVNETVNRCRKEEEGSADKTTKMMVPYHVYQAAQQTEEFDFLTNSYMGPEEPSDKPSLPYC